MPKPKIKSSSRGITTAINQLLGSRAIWRVSFTQRARTRLHETILCSLMRVLLIPLVYQRDKCLFHGWVDLLVVCRLLFEIVRRAAGDKLATIHQPNTVAIFRLVHKVCGDHHGCAFSTMLLICNQNSR